MLGMAGFSVGATIIGLWLLPSWLRRQPRVTQPPGHPAHRHRQDRAMTLVLAALVGATFSLTGLVVAGLSHDAPPTAWRLSLDPTPPFASMELDEVLADLEEGDDAERRRAAEDLRVIAPSLGGSAVPTLVAAHGRLAPHPRRARAVRAALRAQRTPEAAEVLARWTPRLIGRERLETLDYLGECPGPNALARLIETSERPGLVVERVADDCVPRVAGAILKRASDPVDRRSLDRALARGCLAEPARMRDSVGFSVVGVWRQRVAQDGDPGLLTRALACGHEKVLPAALGLRARVDPITRRELDLVEFLRGDVRFDSLLGEMERDPELRRLVDEHYATRSPWRDPIRMLPTVGDLR
tara:strand:+ start:263 stop:1330 length:1068 start_codon:yes stop_codon:yes gene_type:complete